MTTAELRVGGSLAQSAWGGFTRAAKEMAEKGTFTELTSGYSGVLRCALVTLTSIWNPSRGPFG
jgi:hypothetical protein